jgi:3-phosphoshikimate 1-carboxyvinyltransferase
LNALFAPAGRLRGRLRPPPDKSISHRAALLAAMHAEPVRVHNYLDAADTNSTLSALRALGVLVDNRPDELLVRGPGLREAAETGEVIDVGNSGTLMRLLPGWLAAQDGRSFTLDGDESIRRRPVDRIAEPLAMMGAGIETAPGGMPPLTVAGGQLRGIEYRSPVASAQVKSCVLIAGLTADGATTVVEPLLSRDHTERMLTRAGATMRRDGLAVSVDHVDELSCETIEIPGDFSSAAFGIVAGLLVPGSRLLVEDVGVNWTRTGLLRILRRMGAIIVGEIEGEPAPGEQRAEEPVTELDVAHGPLVGTEVGAEEVPLAIDELPLVALAACYAEGETVVHGAGELRLKESDRIAGVVTGLRALGGEIEETADGFAVRGTGGLHGGRLDSRGDHRLAMLGAVAGLASREGVEVIGMGSAAVSYPSFVEDFQRLAA